MRREAHVRFLGGVPLVREAPTRPRAVPLPLVSPSPLATGRIPRRGEAAGRTTGVQSPRPPCLCPRAVRGRFCFGKTAPGGAVPAEDPPDERARCPARPPAPPAARPLSRHSPAHRGARPGLLPPRQVSPPEGGVPRGDAGPVLAVVRPPGPPRQGRHGVRQRPGRLRRSGRPPRPAPAPGRAGQGRDEPCRPAPARLPGGALASPRSAPATSACTPTRTVRRCSTSLKNA